MKKLKTKPELLKSFMKANKERREVLANRAGFNTPDEYRKHLVYQIRLGAPFDGNTSPVVVHNVHILDVSGSMHGGKAVNAMAGINQEIADMNDGQGVTYLQTFVEFSYNSRINTKYFRTPVSEVSPNMSARIGGFTALYQAIGETLERLISNKVEGEKTIVKIFTDGKDNDSQGKYRYVPAVAKIIKEAEDLDITVTFVGVESDVMYMTRNLGIDESNTLVHDNTAKGVADAFNVSKVSTKMYVNRAARGEDTLKGFYKQTGTL